jgi:hypothetical protein
MPKLNLDGIDIEFPVGATKEVCGLAGKEMRRFAPSTLAILATLCVAAAPVQAETIKRELGHSSKPEDVRFMHDFSACVADEREADARKILALDFRTPEYDAAFGRLARRSSVCLAGGRLRSSGMLFAGGIAERLVEKQLAAADAATLIHTDPSRPIQARDEGETIGLCTVLAAPQKAAALFATAPTSKEEGAAIEAILPHLGPCVAAGSAARLNRAGIRSLLALAFYRLSQHNAAAQPAGN